MAQIKGIVKDSITGKAIPYVNISVENENLGTTSEENGEFTIHISQKSKQLIFSALGFEKKTISISKVSEVNLKPTAFQLDEVVISKRFGTREKEIGTSENQIYEAFDNGPRIDAKFFPYFPSYKRTKFIKQVVIVTDSKIDDAIFKIHFYSVDSNGFPGDEILDKDFIVSVNKGVKETKFNVTKFNLRMPKQGIFVGFEKLMIAKNKVEKTVSNANTKTIETQTTYFPFVLYNSVKRDFVFAFSGGKWIRKSTQNENDPSEKITVYEPAINLILTN
ncbi:MAG TPA: carboxypeptidase-like regulatory domain-containing protein [Flavobacterium sp.]|nr:carboxypeptidase-like regulatory domain-containing protein [Flavobacterium sp.]